MRRFARSATGLVAWICSFAACVADAPAPTPPDTTPPAGTPPPARSVTMASVIGPAGGTLSHPSGARLVVPEGALAASTQLTLRDFAVPAGSPIAAAALGHGFEAGPDGQTFHKPVELVLPFEPGRVPAGTDARAMQVHMAPHGSSDFAALDTVVELEAHELRTSTIHFTDFVPALNPNPVFITTSPALPQGTVGTAYSQVLAATGGTSPYSWTMSSGSNAPAGLVLATGGLLSGAPSQASTFAFFVTASDSASHAVQKAFFMNVVPAVNPVPVLTTVSPRMVQLGVDSTINLTGSSFVPFSQVRWDDLAIPTTFVSATSLAAAIPPSPTIGNHRVTVSSPIPGGGTSATITVEVFAGALNPLPTISVVQPSSLPLSSVDTQVAIVGTNFIPQTSAVIGAHGISTRFVSATRLDATIPASYLGAAGTLQLGVYNPTPGGGFSSTLPVIVGAATTPLTCTYKKATGSTAPPDCAVTETVEWPHFWEMFNVSGQSVGLTSDSPALRALYLATGETAYFTPNASNTIYTPAGGSFEGHVERSGNVITVVGFRGRRGFVPGCENVVTLHDVTCSGTTTLGRP